LGGELEETIPEVGEAPIKKRKGMKERAGRSRRKRKGEMDRAGRGRRKMNNHKG